MNAPVKTIIITSEKIIEECIDALMSADNASGYCTCGARVVMHKTKDHAPIDSGDLKAEELVAKLRGLLS